MHRPGIEPGPPAWQASILPLNQRCLDTNNSLSSNIYLYVKYTGTDCSYNYHDFFEVLELLTFKVQTRVSLRIHLQVMNSLLFQDMSHFFNRIVLCYSLYVGTIICIL